MGIETRSIALSPTAVRLFLPPQAPAAICPRQQSTAWKKGTCLPEQTLLSTQIHAERPDQNSDGRFLGTFIAGQWWKAGRANCWDCINPKCLYLSLGCSWVNAIFPLPELWYAVEGKKLSVCIWVLSWGSKEISYITSWKRYLQS